MRREPIILDGLVFPWLHVMDLERLFNVLDTENTGRLRNGDIDRDIIGTYYNYSFNIDQDDKNPKHYDDFYDIISAPERAHNIIVPYGQTEMEFEAYVTNGKDRLKAMLENENRWGDLSFNFIAKMPQRRPR